MAINFIKAQALARIIDRVRDVEPHMEAQYLAVLFDVATHPGTSQAEIVKRLSLGSGDMRASVSRVMSKLGSYKGGKGLIEAVPREDNRRENDVRLTPAGERFINQLTSEMDR